jgi:hypothetical protein
LFWSIQVSVADTTNCVPATTHTDSSQLEAELSKSTGPAVSVFLLSVDCFMLSWQTEKELWSLPLLVRGNSPIMESPSS